MSPANESSQRLSIKGYGYTQSFVCLSVINQSSKDNSIGFRKIFYFYLLEYLNELEQNFIKET